MLKAMRTFFKRIFSRTPKLPPEPPETKIWIGMTSAKWVDNEGNDTSRAYYHFFIQGEKRFVEYTCTSVLNNPATHSFYQKRVLPWILTGDDDLINENLDSFNKEYWIEEQKENKEFKLLKFPKDDA